MYARCPAFTLFLLIFIYYCGGNVSFRFEVSEAQVGEHDASDVSQQRDTQEVISDLMQKLSASEQDALSSRCRYPVMFYNHIC